MPGAKQVAVPNRLLGALPRKEYQKLLPILEPVNLSFGEILYESQTQIRHVYFPNEGLVALACGCYKTVKDTYTQAQAKNGNARPALHK